VSAVIVLVATEALSLELSGEVPVSLAQLSTFFSTRIAALRFVGKHPAPLLVFEASYVSVVRWCGDRSFYERRISNAGAPTLLFFCNFFPSIDKLFEPLVLLVPIDIEQHGRHSDEVAPVVLVLFFCILDVGNIELCIVALPIHSMFARDLQVEPRRSPPVKRIGDIEVWRVTPAPVTGVVPLQAPWLDLEINVVDFATTVFV